MCETADALAGQVGKILMHSLQIAGLPPRQVEYEGSKTFEYKKNETNHAWVSFK